MPIPIFHPKETSSQSSGPPNPKPDSSIPAPSASQTSTNLHPASPRTEAQEAADRLYEERLEEEYAKREGGA
ncbi:hypothetical protein M430DRAFT_34414 [Amorphotheca resinae ATCC 22711]|uniref:Uncharacterized protein n=1 Tax=Amorphotheca resinae ATCC 22711 TaxID=857342 RepID=A0A2T3B2W9_AMORE|nr:hypothetical protein M430DRAFT_34414 [Amorphotheca resinae ATCC 22711]PSS19988.1 hypothetical protein M430DRAFT_34414 [Amorphotheca resinae ATCC 22711]